MLRIEKELIAQIEREAEKSYPNECCGFMFGSLSGEIKEVRHILSSLNQAEEGEKYHRFEIMPEQMMKAESLARKNGWDIVGFYHSHPDCRAIPSEFDRIHALPVYSYVIVSAVKGKAKEFFSWELDENTNYTTFEKENIE